MCIRSICRYKGKLLSIFCLSFYDIQMVIDSWHYTAAIGIKQLQKKG